MVSSIEHLLHRPPFFLFLSAFSELSVNEDQSLFVRHFWLFFLARTLASYACEFEALVSSRECESGVCLCACVRCLCSFCEDEIIQSENELKSRVQIQ